jgi:DNA-binding NtrC family response regulator
MPKILLVDDDPQSLESTRKILEAAGHEVTCARDGSEGLDLARVPVDGAESPFDLIVTDVRMPRMDGMEFLKTLSYCGGGVPVVLMTAFGRVDEAVWAMKMGAVDFLSKPFKRQALMASVESAMKRARVRRRAQQLSPESDAIIGSSSATTELRQLIERVAPTETTVLITGESGTGKELVARRLHMRSDRANAPYVTVNCGALQESLLESELFGHEKGSFTGAVSQKIGLAEMADGGTIFLDEIGEMSLGIQAKLLRFLQEGEFYRIGGKRPIKVNVRVISATNRDLENEVKAGRFREDLYYRLNTITLRMPPLRKRKEDIPLLVDYFMKNSRFGGSGQKIKKIDPKVYEVFQNYDWPGNIRELQNTVERMKILAESHEIQLEDIPFSIRMPKKGIKGESGDFAIDMPLDDVEKTHILRALTYFHGNKTKTAQSLGITIKTLYNKLHRYGIIDNSNAQKQSELA